MARRTPIMPGLRSKHGRPPGGGSRPARWHSGGAWLLAAGVFTALLLPACRPPTRIAFSPEEWSFGVLGADRPVAQEVSVENRSRRPVRLELTSVFDNLRVQPAGLSLRGGEKASFLLSYDPAEDSGTIERRLIIRADGPRQEERILYRVAGSLASRDKDGTAQGNRGEERVDRNRIRFHYYHDPDCKGCTVFLVRLLFSLQNQQGVLLRLVDRDIYQPGVREAYTRRLAELGVEEREYPSIIVGNTVLQGARQIENEFQRLLLEGLGRESAAPDGAHTK